jgi:hypothetical protein
MTEPILDFRFWISQFWILDFRLGRTLNKRLTPSLN